MAASYSPQEKQYYDQLFAIVDTDGTGILPGQDAYPFLTSCNISTVLLGEIWALADPDNNGFLTKDGWYKAARLIGWIQKGGKTAVDESLLNTPGPYPTFDKGPPPPAQAPAPSSGLAAQFTGQRQTNPLSANPTGTSALPPLAAADRAKFTRLFAGCGPSNGLISGDKARDVFLKSNLGYDKLGQIWNLADTQGRGSLDLTDFVIGMYLIQTAMSDPSFVLPSVLPTGTYEAASGGRAQPPSAAAASPIARQHTGGAIPSPIRAQYTGGMSGNILQPQRTGQSATGPATPPRSNTATGTKFTSPPASSTFSTLPSTSSFGGPQRQGSAFLPPQQHQQQQWDVTPQAKATSDQFFSQLDTQGRGVIEGDVAVPFMLQSQLDENTLAGIWDLADIRKEGKLTKDEFAVAMHLINAKLAGQDVPTSLPNSLVPPSLRSEYGQGSQEVLTQGPSSAAKDLFDVFGDDEAIPSPAPPQQQQQPKAFQPSVFLPQPPPPPARRQGSAAAQKALSPTPTGQQSGFGASPFAPQPRGDLLGEDSADAAPSSVPDYSADIGNKQNQLANTTRGLSELEKTREDLEKKAASSAAQLEELESQLTTARAKHETETKAVADLRARVSEQAAKLQRLREDSIAAESDVSALRSEKDELEQALLRDKEEVRGLQKQMKEVEDEKSGLKLVLDKLKKEARQQKGMLSIAKKQLSTAEGSRDAVQQEIKQVENDQSHFEPEPVPTPVQAPFSPGALGTAASVPLPATPQVLSPAATGASTRSNNPFDRLGTRSQPRAAPTPTPPAAATPTLQEGEKSPGLGAGAIAGVGAAVTAAAGVVVAGAETLYDAAKGAITHEEEPQQKTESKELDPFGASEAEKTPVPGPTADDTDPFGVPTVNDNVFNAAAARDTDPFGAPSVPQQTSGQGFDNFDSGFGDSFTAVPPPSGGASKPTEEMHLAPASEPSRPTDFDTAFADFDQGPAADNTDVNASEFAEEGIPAGLPKSAIPTELVRPDAERTLSTQAVAPETPGVMTPATVSVPGTPGSVRSALPPSGLANTVEPEGESSDEEEEPEDLEGPKASYKGKEREVPTSTQGFAAQDATPAAAGVFAAETEPAAPARVPAPAPAAISPDFGLAPALPTNLTEADSLPKTRRSAPPPPSKTSTTAPTASADEFDPFGAPSFAPAPTAAQPNFATGQVNELTLPPGAAPAASGGAAPQTANFDEDEFDFSDLPPAQVEHSDSAAGQSLAHAQVQPNSAFEDDFNFDDEFDDAKQTSDNSNSSKSYEIVSPQPGAASEPQGAGAGSRGVGVTGGGGGYEEWGFGGHASKPSSASGQAQAQGMSFDDAFGGDFEPSQHQQEQYAPPPGVPPQASSGAGQGQLNPPAMPERRPSTAQADDIEDVKKLCAMGFSRGLVIDALDANAYDFQKALNVLLSA